MKFSQAIDFAKDMAQEAGEELKLRFQDAVLAKITRRGLNPQTLADIKSNKLITNNIKKFYPDHAIKSEESLVNAPFCWNYKSNYVWIIDPCDGTVNFISGIPFFSVSIALAYKSNVVLGVVFDPIRNELFYAEKNKGAMLNGKTILINNESELSNATFGIDIGPNPELIIKELDILRALSDKVRVVRSFYSGALELCYVACGRIDIRIDDSFKPWDVAAGTIIATEAGAKITNLKNESWNIHCKSLLATNSSLHKKVIAILGNI